MNHNDSAQTDPKTPILIRLISTKLMDQNDLDQTNPDQTDPEISDSDEPNLSKIWTKLIQIKLT